MNPKPLWKSTGAMGSLSAVVAALVALASALASRKGVEIDGETQAMVVSLVCAVGGGVAGLIGRIKAAQPIGGSVTPERPDPSVSRTEILPDTPWERPSTPTAHPGPPVAQPPAGEQPAVRGQGDLAAALAMLAEALKTLSPPAQTAVDPPANPHPTPGGPQ
ncbi:hypothetical protein NNJEOMEG_03314 [Fundidesulfovibrio magnetotacticus]|uniref:Uncharacterized protein n=1 Tax=Fundidesulfovibrio magnetotacticus TaxID=2730080 RepID=A0A6V8LXX8_9BACT|nr:hypothetical protein [Fundidesulfovibrio magnetotacticus]GFK95451.1 hypothetical protein NNJEOMEG_03314 [Fundidesulfovibrio magnetotacticus]